jgi:hypothetical protein
MMQWYQSRPSGQLHFNAASFETPAGQHVVQVTQLIVDVSKLCICTHGITKHFMIQTNKKTVDKLFQQHQKSFLHSESIKYSYKKEEEKDKNSISM